MSSQKIDVNIELPENFQTSPFLSFYQRDKEDISEKVLGNLVYKGFLWHGEASIINIELIKNKALVKLSAPTIYKNDEVKLKSLSSHMLGLEQETTGFEKAILKDKIMAPIVKAQAGLRIPQTATPFEAIAWAIIGQQISVQAAVSIRGRFIKELGKKHSSGLYAHPDAEKVSQCEWDDLRNFGLSMNKARALLEISKGIVEGKYPLDTWLTMLNTNEMEVDELVDTLIEIKGVGMWTISYTLLRGFNWLNGSMHGDVAVRRNLAQLLGLEKISSRDTEKWLKQYEPWRALVAAHLWAMQSEGGY